MTDEHIIVFYNKNTKPYISVPHLHSQYEIYYNICGARGFMVSGKFYKCNERDLLIIPKTHTHKAIVNKNTEYERCIINVDENAIDSISAMCKNPGCLNWVYDEEGMVSLSFSQHETFVGLVQEYSDCKSELEQLSVFLNIMSFLENAFKDTKKPEYLEDDDISYADRIIRIVEKNKGNISVSDIASQMFLNDDYITRLFKDETGLTLNNYLITRRLAEAKRHLYLGKSVKEACFLSGFNDYSNFIRTFKKFEGYCPGELDELTKPL